jgi:hypothetical protein
MKYWIAKWVINPKGTNRISIQEDNPLVKPLLIDSFYIDDLKIDWYITEYFFEKPSNLDFTEKDIRNFWVNYMTKDKTLEYLRTNTNMKEVEPWKFLVSEEITMMDIIQPAIYIIIS